MRKPVLIFSIVLLLVLCAACGADEPVPNTPAPRPVATRASTPTASLSNPPSAAPPSNVTPQGMDVAISTVTRALQSNDAAGLKPVMLDSIFVAAEQNSNAGQDMTRDAVVQWLNARWGTKRTMVASEYIEHFVLIEIPTTGWLKVAPLQEGVILFHLHRYNAQGQGDPLRGEWRLDSIFYR